MAISHVFFFWMLPSSCLGYWPTSFRLELAGAFTNWSSAGASGGCGFGVGIDLWVTVGWVVSYLNWLVVSHISIFNPISVGNAKWLVVVSRGWNHQRVALLLWIGEPTYDTPVGGMVSRIGHAHWGMKHLKLLQGSGKRAKNADHFPKAFPTDAFPMKQKHLVGGALEHVLFFPSYWEWNHHPNCPTDSYFSEGLVKLVKHQPAKNPRTSASEGRQDFFLQRGKEKRSHEGGVPSWADEMPLLVLTPQDVCRFWWVEWWLPSGKHTKNYGKPPFFDG